MFLYRSDAQGETNVCEMPMLARDKLGHESFQTIARLSPHGVLVFERNQLALANDRALEILGVTLEEARTLRVMDIAAEHEKARVAEAARQAVEGRCPRELGFWIVRPSDGESRYIVNTYSPIAENGDWVGRFVVIEDKTEAKRTEMALRHSEEKYRCLTEQTRHGVVVTVGSSPKIVFVNTAVVEISGYTAEELLAYSSEDLAELVHPDDRASCYWKIFENITSGNSKGSVSWRFMRKDGQIRWVESFFNEIDWEGQVGVQGVIVDVTEQKVEQEKRERLERKMQQAQKLESLGILAGGIAHDFNNLLTGILGCADLAQRRAEPQGALSMLLGDIRTAAKRASELCRQMLAYSGRGHVDFEPLDVKQEVKEMSHLLQAVIPKKIELSYDFGDGVPHIMGDATQIRQVLMNLMTNAADAIGQGKGRITLRTRLVELDSFPEGSWYFDATPGAYVHMCIEDDGCGMDEATLERMFDPFFTTKVSGRGLGLAAVHGIIKVHGGVIQTKSRLHAGTAFNLYLPVGGRQSQSRRHHQSQPHTLFDGESTVLVVDDEHVVRETVAQMLEELGVNVLGAANGKDALELLERRSNVTAILLDLMMPEMDGEEVLDALKQNGDTTPVVVMSGYSGQELSARIAGKDVKGVLQKPFTVDALAELIAPALGVRER